MSGGVTVTQADKDLAASFWRVHPSEIIATGMFREEWYAHHIARHRTTSQAELVEALRGLLLQAAQSTCNDPSNEWGREEIARARKLLAKIEGDA